jgi:small multidrug resistance family-3 protein
MSAAPNATRSWVTYNGFSDNGRNAMMFLIFFLSGVCEIGGGWLIWQTVREGRPAFWAATGSVILVAYGFVASTNPLTEFGRVYAVYGGIFILLSYVWGHFMDGFIPDKGDYVGMTFVTIGVLLMMFWRS